MKTQFTTIPALIAAFACLAFAAPVSAAPKGNEPLKVKVRDSGKVKVKGVDGKVKIKPNGKVKKKGFYGNELAAAQSALHGQTCDTPVRPHYK